MYGQNAVQIMYKTYTFTFFSGIKKNCAEFSQKKRHRSQKVAII